VGVKRSILRLSRMLRFLNSTMNPINTKQEIGNVRRTRCPMSRPDNLSLTEVRRIMPWIE
jgi:hypothetical protein